MITVMGATGRTGGQIADGLLKAGEQVRAVGRSAERLAPLAEAGAELAVGDANDPEFLARAFRGADAVYTLLPVDPSGPDFHGAADRVGEAIVAAVRDSGVPGVVFLSAIGADLPGGTGVVESLHRQEQRLGQLTDTNVLILRPGWSRRYSPSGWPCLVCGMCSFSDAHVEEVLTDAGASADFAKQYLLTNRVVSNQTVRPLRGRNPENTTTRFEEFASELAREQSRNGRDDRSDNHHRSNLKEPAWVTQGYRSTGSTASPEMGARSGRSVVIRCLWRTRR